MSDETSVEVLNINVLKKAISVVANAFMPHVPKKASMVRPRKKLEAKKMYLFL